MSAEKEADPQGETPKKVAEKKPYAPPRLIEYGPAADLIGGGVGSKAENTIPQSMRHP